VTPYVRMYALAYCEGGEKSQSLRSVSWHLIIDHPEKEDNPIKSMGPLKWGDGSAIMSGCGKSLLVLGKTGYAEEGPFT
jgi:hypothetical protein